MVKANNINTPQAAKDSAKKFAEKLTKTSETQNAELKEGVNKLLAADPSEGGFEELSILLMLPEDHFALLAPAFLDEFEKTFTSPNDQMVIVQTLNAAGLKAENIREEYENLCEAIDEQIGDSLSEQKRDFVKRLLGSVYNAAAEAEGIAKRFVITPIEVGPDAKMPTYAHLDDAGADVYLAEDVTIHPGETKLLHTGVKVAVPKGYALLVYPKSGRSLKSKLRIGNSVGVIDSGFRGEVCVIADNIDPVIRSAKMDENGRLYEIEWGSDITLSKGEKIAQLVLTEVPKAVFSPVANIASIASDGRDSGGFGSTGDR